jgi:hypothetical protein
MAESMGVDTSRARMVIFVLAALQACAAGWLYAHLQRFVNPTPFGLHIGIEYLFMAVVGGAGQVWGALVGAGVITVLKQWLQDILPKLFGSAGNYEVIVFGLMMIIVLHRARDGLWPLLARLVPVRAEPKLIDPTAEPLPKKAQPPHGETILEAREVTRKFGGLVANNAMSLSVKAGEILALIGPNGAGKSTMFNQLSGVDTPTSGEVLFRGKSVAGHSSREIAAPGHEPHLPARAPAAEDERARERGHRRPHARQPQRAARRLAPRPGPKRPACCARPPSRSSGWGWASSCTPRPAAWPWASSASSRSPAPCAPTPACCSSTSPPPACA